MHKSWQLFNQSINLFNDQSIKMSLFRRKKTGKVIPVKISTMDAELEFSLDYKVKSNLDIFSFIFIIMHFKDVILFSVILLLKKRVMSESKLYSFNLYRFLSDNWYFGFSIKTIGAFMWQKQQMKSAGLNTFSDRKLRR